MTSLKKDLAERLIFRLNFRNKSINFVDSKRVICFIKTKLHMTITINGVLTRVNNPEGVVILAPREPYKLSRIKN